MGEMRVGIASFAHMHAYSYAGALQQLEGVTLSGFWDANEGRARKVSQTTGMSRFTTIDDLASSEGVDVVLVTSETKHHAAIAIKAFEAGKDVIVEKPIATSLDDARAMIDSAKKHGRRLFQCYPCRYHASAQKVKEMVDAGELGKITGITATNHGCMPDHHDPELRWFSDKELAGGGAVMDHTTHAADLIFWLTGLTPRSVFGTAKQLFFEDIDVDDAGMVLLSLEGGVAASIDPSWSRPSSFPTWGDLTMRLYGTGGTVAMDLFNQNIAIHSDAAPKTTTWFSFGSDVDEAMLADFVAAWHGENDAPVSGEDGYQALKVAIKAYESSNSGTVVPW